MRPDPWQAGYQDALDERPNKTNLILGEDERVSMAQLQYSRGYTEGWKRAQAARSFIRGPYTQLVLFR